MSQLNLVPVDNSENNNIDNLNGGFSVGGEEFYNENSSANQEEGLGNDQAPRRSRRKRYHRHSQYQIQEMELFFNQCPHPDDKQKNELSEKLGLDPLQIKFWFQNKRTQMKTQGERQENLQLRAENEYLRSDNKRYRDAIQNAICPRCTGKTAVGEMSVEEHQLRIENAQLEEEMDRLSALLARYEGKMIMSHPQMSRPAPPPPFESEMMRIIGRDVSGNGNLLGSPTDANKPIIIELGIRAMEELMMMTQVGEPLWMGGVNGTSLVLNLDEYSRTSRMGLGPRTIGFRTEASRDTMVVPMNYMSIVEGLMTENQWSTIFSGMITGAMTHEQLLVGSGAGNLDGALQIMSAEFQLPSPLVSTRESYFVRYCKQQGDGVWAVVDVSIDHLHPNIKLNCRKRPSGCLIQEIPSGYTKVTWIEHVEVNDALGVYHMYKHLINSGQAFGANRWLATLNRECERIASIIAIAIPSIEPDGSLMLSDQGKRGILKLAGRMVRSFLGEATTLLGSTYTGGLGDDIRVMKMKTVNDPGKPPGIVLCVATSFWVSVSPKTMFDFLRDDKNRNGWDVLSAGGIVQKLTQIGNGRNVKNCVTLLRMVNSTYQDNTMTIQETSTDPTASYVIYAPADVAAIEKAANGYDNVCVLPSGFVILPDGMSQSVGDGGGSLLTISFQMLVEKTSSAKLTVSSVATIENLVRATVLKIKTMFPMPNQPSLNHPPFGV